MLALVVSYSQVGALVLSGLLKGIFFHLSSLEFVLGFLIVDAPHVFIIINCKVKGLKT